VNDGWARLVIFLLGDPHLLEGREGGEDRSSDPYGVFPLWRSDDLDLHGAWSKSNDFLLHTVSNSWVHGGTSGQNGVSVQVLISTVISLESYNYNIQKLHTD
jgi:hypothetical protein